MMFARLIIEIWTHSKMLFIVVMTVILVHIYYNTQFALLARKVDNRWPVPHPIAFEAFPFVVYNMYSGKIDDWNKYSYLKLEADGEEVILTDLAIIQEDQFVNPTQKFLNLKMQNFEDAALLSYIQYALGSYCQPENIYKKVSNQSFLNNEAKWQNWLKKYVAVTINRKVNSIKIIECVCSYNNGIPKIEEEKLLYKIG